MDEAKKVVIIEDDDGFVEGYGQIIRTTYECPNCYARLIQYEDRCPKCEQKLKWYEVNADEIHS